MADFNNKEFKVWAETVNYLPVQEWMLYAGGETEMVLSSM